MENLNQKKLLSFWEKGNNKDLFLNGAKWTYNATKK